MSVPHVRQNIYLLFVKAQRAFAAEAAEILERGIFRMGTIALEEAERISDLTVFGFGMGLTFVGLICIILICMIMGKLCSSLIKEEPKKAEAPLQSAKPAQIANKGELAAAVAAAVAEENGTDVSGIKILSIKQL